jgi:hypothetical protein
VPHQATFALSRESACRWLWRLEYSAGEHHRTPYAAPERRRAHHA